MTNLGFIDLFATTYTDALVIQQRITANELEWQFELQW